MAGNKKIDYNFLKKTIVALLILFVVFISLQLHSKALSGLNVEGFEKNKDEKIVWKNNPFVKPANEVAASELRLTGVIWNENKAAVIINDEILKIGDRIGFNEIIDIEKTHVILRNENGLFSLRLKGGK